MANLPTAYAESSNAAKIHPFLQFTTLHYQERYQKLKYKEVLAISSIDWQRIGMFDFSGLLARSLQPNTPWRRFFDILEPSYDELVYEFLSTFYYKSNENLTNESIHFQLCGQLHTMSLTEFAVHLGIYTDEEVKQPIFTEASTSGSSANMVNYWQYHSLKEWCINNNSTSFIDPCYQYMHRVLAHTITGRKHNLHRVKTIELFYLYSIFEQVPCNIAHELAEYFSSQQSNPMRSPMGGSYITKIAQSLGVLSDQIIQGLSPPKAPGVINPYTMRLTPIHISTLSQPSQSEGAPVILENTFPQNLQQSSSQFLPSSFYRYDIQPQLPYIHENIPTDPPQSLAPNVSQDFTPIVFEEAPMTQDELFDGSMMIQDQLGSESFLQSPLSPHFFQSLMNEVGQLPPTDRACPSTMPQMHLPPDRVVVEMARLSNQVQDLSRQVQWLTERNNWLEDMLRQLAARMELTLPLPPLFSSESEFDSFPFYL